MTGPACRSGLHPRPTRGRCRPCHLAAKKAYRDRQTQGGRLTTRGERKGVRGPTKSMRWHEVKLIGWRVAAEWPCRVHGAPPLWGYCTFCVEEVCA